MEPETKTRVFVSSILAGVCISLGCCIYLSLEDKIIGAILFACGLMAVRIIGLDLFTGKVQFIFSGKSNIGYYVSVLIGNILGCFFLALLTANQIHDSALAIALLKSGQSMAEAFIKGTLCGMLMTIATHKKTPLYISVLCVASFILAGFNHCIADAFYLMAGKHFCCSWLATMAGNVVGGALLGITYRHVISA